MSQIEPTMDADPALVNAVAEDGFGPLGLACFFELLLAFGADWALRDGEGHSAADHARSRGHEDAARHLGPG